MKKYNRLKSIIGILSIVLFISFIINLLLIFNSKTVINNFLFIMQSLSYMATIIGAGSIMFAYVQYKNIKKENNNKISSETIKMLDDFATKVIPYMDNIDKEYDILSDRLDNRIYNKTLIKSKALKIKNYEINYIDLWCKCLLIFKDRNMIQEEVIYDEDYYALMDFLNNYMEAFKYDDPNNIYYKTMYIIYNRWTNNDFHNINNE